MCSYRLIELETAALLDEIQTLVLFRAPQTKAKRDVSDSNETSCHCAYVVL
jgi:hypothetical protein